MACMLHLAECTPIMVPSVRAAREQEGTLAPANAGVCLT
jgi:hypothetical protein